LKRYEVIFISLADLTSEEMDDVIEKYKSIINDMDGKIVKFDKWGKRRLAYQIRKKREGFYTLIDFGGDHKIIQELERNFKIDDKILRYQSVKLSDKVDPEALEREIEAAQKQETPPEASPIEDNLEESASKESTEPEESTGEPEESAEELEGESSQEEKTGE